MADPLFCWQIVLAMAGVSPGTHAGGWPALEILVAGCDCPQHLVHIKDDGARDVVLPVSDLADRLVLILEPAH